MGTPAVYKPLEKEDWHVLSDLASEIAAMVIADMEAGEDDDREPGFEESLLYEQLRTQIGFMESKYGPHPIILDTKADFTDDLDEKIRLKEGAIALCLPDDFKLRGNIAVELAELFFEEKKDLAKAGLLIEASIRDLEKDGVSSDLSAALELRNRISKRL